MEKNVTEQWEEEFNKCKDPVYFYTHYLKIKDENDNWIVPPPLSEKAKEDMRIWTGFSKPKFLTKKQK